MDAAVKAFGTVHILINNAGILRKPAFLPHPLHAARRFSEEMLICCS